MLSLFLSCLVPFVLSDVLSNENKASALKELKNQHGNLLKIGSNGGTKDTPTKMGGSFVEDYYHAVYYAEIIISSGGTSYTFQQFAEFWSYNVNNHNKTRLQILTVDGDGNETPEEEIVDEDNKIIFHINDKTQCTSSAWTPPTYVQFQYLDEIYIWTTKNYNWVLWGPRLTGTYYYNAASNDKYYGGIDAFDNSRTIFLQHKNTTIEHTVVVTEEDNFAISDSMVNVPPQIACSYRNDGPSRIKHSDLWYNWFYSRRGN